MKSKKIEPSKLKLINISITIAFKIKFLCANQHIISTSNNLKHEFNILMMIINELNINLVFTSNTCPLKIYQ